MSDDPGPKKSMREQVEEYKRKQREAEGEEQDFTGEERDFTEEQEEEFDNLEARVAEAHARGPNVGKLVGVIFTLIGLVLLAVTGAILYFTQQSIAAEVEAQGVVVRNELRHYERSSNSSSSSRGSTDLWHAVVDFKLQDGTPKTVEMTAGYWPKQWDEGEAVTVRYDPARPLTARIANGSGMDYFAPAITGFLGLVFTIVGASVWRLLGRG